MVFESIATGATVAITIKAIDNFSNSFNKAQTGMQKLGSVMKVGATALVGATAALGAIGKSAISASIDFEETASKFGVVFSELNSEAEEVAKNLADNFGLSGRAAKQLLSDTGDLLTGFGFVGQEALDLSQQVNELAVDLASFTNIEGGAERASQALNKALLGERESLKSLGIAILETDIKQRAREKGLLDITDAQSEELDILRETEKELNNFIEASGLKNDEQLNSLKLQKESIKFSLRELALRKELTEEEEASVEAKKLEILEIDKIISSTKQAQFADKGLIDSKKELLKETSSQIKLLEEATGELTRQQKAQITLELATEQSKNAVGDFSRTSDSAANQIRILKATFEDLQIELGQQVLPVFVDLLNIVSDEVIPAIQPLIPLIGDFLKRALQFVAPLLPKITESFSQLIPVIFDVFDAVEPLIDPLFEIGEILFPIILDVIKTMIPVIKTLTDVLGPLLEMLAPVVEFLGKIISFIAKIGGKVLETAIELSVPGQITRGARSKKRDIAEFGRIQSIDKETIFLGEGGNNFNIQIDKVQGVDADEITELMAKRLSLEIRR